MRTLLKAGWERRHLRALHTSLILSAVLLILLVASEALHAGKLFSSTDRNLVWLIVVNVVAVLGLQIFSGNSGRMTIAHAGFIAMGAYISVLFTINPAMKKSVLSGLPDWLYATDLSLASALIVAVAATAITAWLLGFVVVRLGYDGVVISTFALLLIVQSVILAAKGWTNGLTSVFGMPRVETPWLLAIVAIAAIALCAFFKESRAGLQLRAARDDQPSAEAMGVNTRRLNHIAWVFGAVMAAAAGALMVHILGAASPRNFYIVMTVELIAMLVLGGQRSVSGAVAGAVFVSALIVVVRKIEGGISVGSLQVPPIFGATQFVLSFSILAILYLKPDGFFGLKELAIRKLLPTPLSATSGESRISDSVELTVNGLSKSFGGLKALNDVSFSIRSGEILGLIGPNGAGKSTLINTIMGSHFATTGSVVIGGSVATLWSAAKLARGGVGRTFQQIRLAETLTVAENVALPLSVVSPAGKPIEATALGWLQRFGIDHLAERYPGELAYGDQRRVEVARALALGPTFLLLDEPAAGMNHTETAELRKLLSEIRDELGIGIIIVEHDLHLIMTMCDKVVVLNRGQLIASGSPAEIRADPHVIDAYIGREDDQPMVVAGQAGAS